MTRISLEKQKRLDASRKALDDNVKRFPRDYDIHYRGMIIGNLKACTDGEALKLAKKTFKASPGFEITISKVRP